VENAKDIIACGLDFDRTFVFSDVDYMGHLYPNVLKIWKSVNYATARSAFGFTPQSNIGQSAFPAIQAAPSFPSSFDVPFSELKDPQNMARRL
jgi:tryptophanyl-tRNA synthetase